MRKINTQLLDLRAIIKKTPKRYKMIIKSYKKLTRLSVRDIWNNLTWQFMLDMIFLINFILWKINTDLLLCARILEKKKNLYIDNQKGLVTDEIKRKYLV